MKKGSKRKIRRARVNPSTNEKLYPIYEQPDGTYKVTTMFSWPVDNSPVHFSQPGTVRRTRAWVRLDGKLKLKTILAHKTEKDGVREYITTCSLEDEGKVVHLRDAFQVVDEDGSLTEFGRDVVYHYAYHSQQEIRLHELERCWPELISIFTEIQNSDIAAFAYGVPEDEFFQKVLWTGRRVGEIVPIRPATHTASRPERS